MAACRGEDLKVSKFVAASLPDSGLEASPSVDAEQRTW